MRCGGVTRREWEHVDRSLNLSADFDNEVFVNFSTDVGIATSFKDSADLENNADDGSCCKWSVDFNTERSFNLSADFERERSRNFSITLPQGVSCGGICFNLGR